MLVVQLLEATSMDQVHRTRQQVQVVVDTAKHAMYQQRVAQPVNMQALAAHLSIVIAKVGVDRHVINLHHVIQVMIMFHHQENLSITIIEPQVQQIQVRNAIMLQVVKYLGIAHLSALQHTLAILQA